MKTISVRDLQQHVRDCVRASQKDRLVVTRHGSPAAVIIGVEGADWDTLALQTNQAFWRMLEKRRAEPTISLSAMKKTFSGNNGKKQSP